MRKVFDKKGTALIVTMVYLIVVSIICAVVLGFSSGHYRLMSQRVEKFQNMYYAEGGFYLGLNSGVTGNATVDINTNATVDISRASEIQSKRHYEAM